MKKRFFIPVLLVFVCASVMAQPEIVSITYGDNEAILTRNTPPAGIIYYWQGSSCGTLMNHNGSTTVATTSGTFYLREYYSSSMSWATSCASTIVIMPDVTSPVLSGVTAGPIEEGDNIAATSNEDGMIYLVPAGTSADYSSIVASHVASASATANVAVSLLTTGLSLGDYLVYAADDAHNISTASAITITDLTAPVLSDVSPGPLEPGENVAATSNEDGMIYLVPDGTAANIGAISAAKVAEASATAGVPVALATTGIGLGDYIVFAVDGFDNVSSASGVIEVLDLTAPVLSDVTAGPIEAGSTILATSNEDGMVYLVPDGTAPNIGDISSGQVAQIAALANVASSLETTGIAAGDYVVYAIDGSDNISAASHVIAVTWPTSIDPNKAGSDQVQVYPSIVTNILYIESEIQVSSVMVYTLQGAKVISIDTTIDQINMSGLADGVYIVKVLLVDNTIFSGKISKL